MKVTALYCYPIKSFGGIPLDTAEATRTGFPNDRRFMLQRVLPPETTADGTQHPLRYRNMSIGSVGRMALFHQDFVSREGEIVLAIKFKDPQTGVEDHLDIPLKPEVDGLEQHPISLHKLDTTAYRMGPKYDQWFSKHFEYEVILVYIGPYHRSVPGNINPSWDSPVGWSLSMLQQVPVVGSYMRSSHIAEIDFADVAAYLVTTEESLANVSTRLPEGDEMDMRKFRPNIVLAGSPQEWDEDYWAEIRFLPVHGGEPLDFMFTANCGRCNSINVDYATGKNGTGPSGRILSELRKDRCVDPGQKYSPIFGRYGFLTKEMLERGHGKINVGDEVEIVKRNAERTVVEGI